MLTKELERLVWWASKRALRYLHSMYTIQDIAQSMFLMLLELERRHPDKPDEELIKMGKVAIHRHPPRLYTKLVPFDELLEFNVMARPSISDKEYRKIEQFMQTLNSLELAYFEMLLTDGGFINKETEVFYRFGRTKSWASKMETKLRIRFSDFLEMTIV